MTGTWVMTDTDIRALLGVFERCQAAADDDIFYADVLTGLRELIPCDDIAFQLMDVADQRVRQLVVTDEGVQREESVGGSDEYLQLFWQEFWEPRTAGRATTPPCFIRRRGGARLPGQARRWVRRPPR